MSELGITVDQPEDIDEQPTYPSQNQLRDPYPELQPGRALINLATNELIEIFHGPEGGVKPMDGFYAGKNEGFKENHLVIEQWIGYRVSDCPPLNNHNEIPVVKNNPDQSDITHATPSEFKKHILESQGETPFLIAERPAISHTETVSGESFELIGWYYPYGEKSNRVRDINDMDSVFPNIEDGRKLVEPSSELRKYHDLNLTFDWHPTATPDDYNIIFGRTDDTIKAKVIPSDQTADLHIHSPYTNKWGDTRACIDSPFEAKKHISQRPDEDYDAEPLNWYAAHPSWNSERTSWVVDLHGNEEALESNDISFDHAISYVIDHLINNYGPITISGYVFEKVATVAHEFTEVAPIGNSDVDPDAELISSPQSQPESDRPDFDIISGTYRGDTPDATIQSVEATNESSLTFLNLSNTLADDASTAITIEGVDILDEIPITTRDEWTTDPSSDARYSFYHIDTGTTINIKAVSADDVSHDIWGGDATIDVSNNPDYDCDEIYGEFAIEVDELWNDEPEIVACLADERMAVQTAITHMTALAE